MKILYIGQLTAGGTCLDRMRTLQRLGHEVIGFDVASFQSPFRLIRSIQWRMNPRVLLQRLNTNIKQEAEKAGRFDLLWIDKGVWIFPDTVTYLRNRCGERALHFTPDAQILSNRSRHFDTSIPSYDHIVTTKSFEVDLYRAAGARHVILSQQSYCPVRYERPSRRECFRSNVGFIGHYERQYGRYLSAIAGVGGVHVWGNGWIRAGRRRQISRRLVCGEGLWGVDYVDALASFQIGLGLLSKYIPEEHTTRTFEIPAAGTFLLAERTPEHEAFFVEGSEAEFFDSDDELISKARFYLANDSARRRIAERGRERCRVSGYDTDSVLTRVLQSIQ